MKTEKVPLNVAWPAKDKINAAADILTKAEEKRREAEQAEREAKWAYDSARRVSAPEQDEKLKGKCFVEHREMGGRKRTCYMFFAKAFIEQKSGDVRYIYKVECIVIERMKIGTSESIEIERHTELSTLEKAKSVLAKNAIAEIGRAYRELMSQLPGGVGNVEPTPAKKGGRK